MRGRLARLDVSVATVDLRDRSREWRLFENSAPVPSPFQHVMKSKPPGSAIYNLDYLVNLLAQQDI